MDRLAIPAMVAINFVEMSGPWMTLSPRPVPNRRGLLFGEIGFIAIRTLASRQRKLS